MLVIAPELSAALRICAERGQIAWRSRRYQSGDLAGAWLVQTATADPSIDDAVARDAEAAQIWCLKGGDRQSASAWAPATVRVDDVTIAVNTNGDARRATRLRDAIGTALEAGDLPLRHHTHHPGGRVALVGAGPGDPGLLTTRGRRLIAEADVIVVDRLAPHGFLEELDADVEVIDVGKMPDHHPVPQERINELLVERARAGKVVVRLKGGDPFVFGRGGEELLACRAAGVPTEVVPGVSSAISVAAAAGIPVTHRGTARGFTVVSGHERTAGLPRGGDHTLILLMGVARLQQTTTELLADGHCPTTPAAVIERGFAPDQRATTGTLSDIADRAAAAGARSPAVIVVGDVVTALLPRIL